MFDVPYAISYKKNLLFSYDDTHSVYVHEAFLKNCNTKNGKGSLAMCLDFFRLIHIGNIFILLKGFVRIPW